MKHLHRASLFTAVLSLLVAVWCVSSSRLLRAEPASARKVDFTRDVRPILSDNCFACHGPDEKVRMGNLRLDTREGLFGKLENGAVVIVPGDPKASRLFQKISASNEAERMPPSFSDKKLSPQQVETIRAWIEQGARWETHWAFVPPVRPALPKVRAANWPRNDIDRFVLARLERDGLKPAAEADKVTLIRRLSLDLTGLPPTPAEVDAFTADKSADAYEKLVDRLLASPHYGERMALTWLDLSRYADTHGYHIDSHRDMWHWRDWVIQAFNRNLRFDEFVTWQLAGDLLPNATREQKLATGFNRNHIINYEGGAIADEYLNEYVADRVQTTSTVFLGLTMGCARCHDHKFDPLTQKEFYQFYAFFNNVTEKGLDGRKGNAPPMLALGTDEQERRQAGLKEQVKRLEEVLADKVLAPAEAEWEKNRLEKLPQPPRDAVLAHYELDGSLSDVSGNYAHGRTIRGEVSFGDGMVGRAATLSGETQMELPGSAALDTRDVFSIAFWVKTAGMRERAILQRIDPAQHRRGWETAFEESTLTGYMTRGARLIVRLVNRWPESAIEVRTRDHLVIKKEEVGSPWHHIVIDYDGSGKAAGLKVWVNAKAVETEILRDSLSGSIATTAPISAGNPELGPPFSGSLDDIRIYKRRLSQPEIETLAVHEPVRSLLWANIPAAKRNKAQNTLLREYFLTRDASEKLRSTFAELKRVKEDLAELERSIPTSMVMAEMEKPRETFVLGRGDYRNKTVKVSAGVPAVLPPLPDGAAANRLALARWLVNPAHPLTARVTVNRFWQMYFGTGLVKTSEDFGSQGEVPSHPELLDWLATEFVRSGWDVRGMQRLIVTSATYRQSSRATPALIEKDPENRLMARGPRFRLPAELVRDNALAASGLLVRKIGGPGVNPYQPPGLWEAISFGDVYSAQHYTQSHGEDLYRRSMYTFWKRTSPPPALIAFDAPDREKCVSRRATTNTPLQALALMNDPTYVEAARALAQKLVTGARTPSERVRLAYRLAVARAPAAGEVRTLEQLASAQLMHYRKQPGAAAQLLSVGESRPDAKLDRAELAAWTTVASVVLQLDETITKE